MVVRDKRNVSPTTPALVVVTLRHSFLTTRINANLRNHSRGYAYANRGNWRAERRLVHATSDEMRRATPSPTAVRRDCREPFGEVTEIIVQSRAVCHETSDRLRPDWCRLSRTRVSYAVLERGEDIVLYIVGHGGIGEGRVMTVTALARASNQRQRGPSESMEIPAPVPKINGSAQVRSTNHG
jgi:hypothetical protein